jgi:hypothetical protein
MKKGRQEGVDNDAEKGRKARMSKGRHTMNDKDRTHRNMNRRENRTEQNRT